MIKGKVFRWARVVTLAMALALSSIPYAVPVYATVGVFENVAGTYTLRAGFAATYLDGTRGTRATAATLTISDNTTATFGVIGTSSLVVTGVGTVAMTGYVGTGANPRISLIGADTNTVVNINGRMRVTATKITLSGRADGFAKHSGGELGDDAVAAVASWSSVATKTGSIAALLTQDAGTGSTYVQFTPPTGIHVSDLATMSAADWGLWYKLQDTTSGGPQLELRFTAPTNVNPDGNGHVDITLLTPTTGTGLWVNRTYNTTFASLYYGNDPYDGTAFDGPVDVLGNQTALINAEAAMLANGGYTCNDWELTRVRVEIWEGGVRTCYVDDVEIDGHTYSFEPVQLTGTFSGTYTIP